jgi:hypothetical protein
MRGRSPAGRVWIKVENGRLSALELVHDFSLRTGAAPETRQFHARFWQTYGEVEQTQETGYLQAVYEGMHIGTALAWATHHDDDDTVQRGQRDLRAVVKRLQSYWK